MRDARDARLFFGATSVVVTFGLLLSSSSPSPKTAGSFASTPARILNFFSFFTVQSNILVAVTTGWRGESKDRRRCCSVPDGNSTADPFGSPSLPRFEARWWPRCSWGSPSPH
jgi:hypothetical protein